MAIAADALAARHVLTVDVGNTTTRFGLFAMPSSPAAGPAGPSAELLASCELTTQQPVTADEVRIQLASARSLLPAANLDGAILSCVVPALTQSWRHALETASASRPLVVGPGLKTGVRMDYDDPAEVGPDRIADVVAARALFGAPLVVVDLGTTTNFEVIDQDGSFAGGIIAPGVELGARSLFKAAARLPMIELKTPRRIVGRNTREAMQSGVVLGEAARIDGLIDAIARETGFDAPVVLTGMGAASFEALLAHKATVDEDLTLRGLALIWQKNAR